MDAAQDGSNQENGNLAEEVNGSLGVSDEAGNEATNPQAFEEENTNDPLFVQKRLKQQKRVHDREMRALHAKIEAMQSNGPKEEHYPNQSMNPYGDAPQGGDMAEHIHRAVNQVLAHKEEQERKIKKMQEAQHINKQYQDLHDHLDNVADKYDDFDDVVRGNAPFTEHMRDASLFLPQTGPGSAGEVLYKLGKNPKELARISELHPLEQARELNKLSHALAAGSESKNSGSSRPMGNIKSNPVVNSPGITEKTSPAEIRARMKAGKFK